MNLDFNGKTAIVTGAASGIGAATARDLARYGATVVLADMDENGMSSVTAEIWLGPRRNLPASPAKVTSLRPSAKPLIAGARSLSSSMMAA